MRIVQKVTFFGSRLWNGPLPNPTRELIFDGCSQKALVHDGGMILLDGNGLAVSITVVMIVTLTALLVIQVVAKCFSTRINLTL